MVVVVVVVAPPVPPAPMQPTLPPSDREPRNSGCGGSHRYDPRDDGYDEGFSSVGLGVRWTPGK